MDAKLKYFCKECNKEFLRYKNSKRSNLFCSKKCYYISLKNRLVTWKRPRKLLEILTCDYCSQPIQRYPSTTSKNNYCSRGCKGSHFSLHKIGEQSFNWRGGRYSKVANQLSGSRYRKIRMLVIQLDDKKCQLCASGEHLEVHHIIERGKNPALIFDIMNLITLCKSCHKSIRCNEYRYADFFDGIVAKRPNSVEPRTGNTEPSIAQARACVENMGSSGNR